MTATVDRTRELVEQVAIRGYAAEGSESLPLARTLLESAAAVLEREPDRMGAWRLVGAVLEARKAFKSHMALCKSPYGPLARAGESQEVTALLAEHEALLRALDELITFANRDRAASPASASALKDVASECVAALDGYERRYRAVVFTAPAAATPTTT